MKDYDYSAKAEHYDFLEGNSISEEAFNEVLDKLLKKYKKRSILDITCGTGTQSIYLHKKGYDVTASDLSKGMIAIAQKKYPQIKFHQADMRTAKFGKFDAIISIFNAIGHLSKPDFEKAIKNIGSNLNQDGIYIFDIFNLDFMKNNFKDYEFIDTCKEVEGTKYVRFNKNMFDLKKGIMFINQKTYIQNNMDKPEVFKDSWDMQIYSSEQLRDILNRNGFEVLKFLNREGKKFDKDNSLFILTIAKKK